jgi:hypothetical protein
MTLSEITVDRAVVRYQLDALSLGQQPRFDRVLSEEVGSGLEGALDEVMRRFGRDAIVCVRRLEVALRLDSSAPNRVLADAWTSAVADAVMEIFVRGGEDVVVYRSLAQPMTEIARAAIGGSDQRAWAWQQLGLWTPTDGLGMVGYTRALGRAACEIPSFAPRVLADAVRRDRTLLTRLADFAPAIAVAVLRRAGLSEIDARQVLQGTDHDEPSSTPVRSEVRRADVADDPIHAALRSFPMSSAMLRAWVVIGLADSEPSRLQPNTVVADVDVRLISRIAPDATSADDPMDVTAPIADLHGDDPSAMPSELALESGMAVQIEAAVDEHRVPDETDADESKGYPVTEWGGLLFVLNLVDAEVLDLLQSVPFRPALVTIASLLADTAEQDPGVQAFAGCLGAVEQSDAPPLPGLDRADTTAVAAARGTAQLLLRRLADLGFPDAEHVLRRRATLWAEPGWLEAEFSVDEVDLDTRRTGLDIDPGWLPWLGTVVKFRYA